MKKRKKLIKRIGAVLCALVVAVSSMGVCVPYYGAIDSVESARAFLLDYYGVSRYTFEHCVPHEPFYEVEPLSYYFTTRDYYMVTQYDYGTMYIYSSNNPLELTLNITEYKGNYSYSPITKSYAQGDVRRFAYYGSSWQEEGISGTTSQDIFLFRGSFPVGATSIDELTSDVDVHIVDANYDVFLDGYCIYDCPTDDTFNMDDLMGKYNPALGYLQNVSEKRVYDEVPLGETVNDKFTARWYYDQFSTTGIDLTSGDYFIRYSQERWIVKGYDKDDVIEKSDRYILGDYIVQNGYIETYSEDIESTLHGQGYENPSSLDLLWNKFVTTHHYFQIFNASTNEIGGCLHVYYTDDNGKFGVEYIGETLDNEGNYDDSGYKDFIDDDSITSDDVEGGFEDLENGTSIDFGQIDGVDGFDTTIETYIEEMQNVTAGVRVLLSSYPAWILGLLGLSFAFLIISVIFGLF